MPHKNLSMTFDDFRIVQLLFEVNEGYKKKKSISISTQISVGYKYDKKKKALVIRLKVISNKENAPFFFQIECEGIFTFDKIPDEKILESFSVINCPAIMFPYVRETIADLTRRAGFAPFHMTPVNFINLSKKNEKVKKPITKKKKTLKK